MNTEVIKKAVEESAAVHGADGYEVNIQSTTRASAEALKDEISSVNYTRSGAMTVRCVKGGKSGYASSELVTAEEAAALVQRACENALVVDDFDEVPLFAGSAHYTEIQEKPAEPMSAESMKENTMQLQKIAYATSDKVVDGTQSFTSYESEEVAFLNSAGLDLSYTDAIAYHGVAAAVKDGEQAEEHYEVGFIGEETVEETAQRAVQTALSQLGADSIPSGKYDIVMDASTMRSLLSVYSSVFSARSAFLKTTLLAGREGEKVASDNFSLIDDPFYPTKHGRCPFDAEGVAVFKKNVIEHGVLKTLLYNRMYAAKFHCETTGNAASAKTIAPKGLYIEAGDLTSEALLEKLQNGLYITKLNGLHAGANVQSGEFSLEASGFMVENGRKTKPVKNITIADNFYALIKKVEALSDTVDFGVSFTFGSPEVMFKDVSVSGQ